MCHVPFCQDIQPGQSPPGIYQVLKAGSLWRKSAPRAEVWQQTLQNDFWHLGIQNGPRRPQKWDNAVVSGRLIHGITWFYNVERCFCDMGMGQNNLPLLNAKKVLTHSTLMHSKQKYFGAEIDWLTSMFILACSLYRLNLLHAASCRHGHGMIWGSGMNQHDKCVSKTFLDTPPFLARMRM